MSYVKISYSNDQFHVSKCYSHDCYTTTVTPMNGYSDKCYSEKLTRGI